MLPDDLLQPVGHAVEQLRALPWAAHALAAGALASGLVLWLIGRRVLKPMVVVLFALIGAGVGFVGVPMTMLAGSVSVYVGLAVGLALGALLGVVLYRSAMAVGLGLVLGVAAPLTVAAVMSFKADQYAPAPVTSDGAPIATTEPDGDAELDRIPARITEEVLKKQIDNLRRQLNGDPDAEAAPTDPPADGDAPPTDAALEDVMRSTAERVAAFARAVGADAAAGWEQLSPRHRLVLTGSAGLGLALGIILGVILPTWAAGMVTALLGAGVWLAAGTWLALALAIPGSEHLQRPAREWLVIWLAVAALGMLAQWAGLVKRKRKGHKSEPARD